MNAFPQTDAPISLLTSYSTFFPSAVPTLTAQIVGRALWVAAEPRQDALFRVASTNYNCKTMFNYRSAKRLKTLLRRPLPSWSHYASGMLLLLSNMEMEIPGFDVVVDGDEGSDTRYAYTVGMGFALTFYHFLGQTCTEQKLLDLTDRVRRDYVVAR